ncbi:MULTISPECIES: hypothetical protein [Pseudoxanthomonas]|uniref:GNAT family N-acetyltransferase n=1 Tax=Pseudoxanthomonas winnipegensis TaxID=2480810 RepID=A0A4Q8LQQ3_9GAMM|nr:hypothetical protein [Pseudoxanthomonas winnipegensis]RZZ89684.1 hypothetical protein EA662_04770 [Pseudoxanthomonas winnipegensis]TAA32890.1 hypothetical protein EA661_00990 [Pseudoxanthomonas winnipegensis]TAA43134.1 hypothetical protein EAT51_05495 [Pseudoxanthomonas winnipegensis]TBV78627.1 hypothetical protein EYC46_01675 [Pseudoxanthomonas winnipegensis]
MSPIGSAASAIALPPTGAGLRVVRLGPGQAGAPLRAMRRRLAAEQGREPEPDDALEASATVVAVFAGEAMVAAVRVHATDTPQLRRELGTLLQLDRFSGIWAPEHIVVGSRLQVLADFRTRQVIDALLRESYRLVRDSDVRFGLIACEPALHALFAFYGFREYLPPAILPGDTGVLRMALVCEDASTFITCGSPLVDLVQHPQLGLSARAWLEQTFPVLV